MRTPTLAPIARKSLIRAIALGSTLLLLSPIVPLAIVRANHSPTHYLVTHVGTSFAATSSTKTFNGALKTVVESAVADLNTAGGGTLTFESGVFDLGSSYFRLVEISNIVIEGQGIDVTIIKNFSTASADTEPFNTRGTYNVVIRDLTVVAGGSARGTSDALDMDRGNNDLIERVKITASRGKGIIFDGKDAGWTSTGNTVRDCEISGTNNDGIQFLASTSNRVENCFVHDTVGDGIEATKSQSNAAQPNKKSSDNVIVGNRVDNAGESGVRINSSDRNVVVDNDITNSSDDRSGRSGIFILSMDSITCDDNRVESNVATDSQATKTQAYGLNIDSPNCHRTFVADNDFSGNKTAAIRDRGTGTIFGSADTEKPSKPTGLGATAISSSRIDLSWTASTDNVGVTGYTVVRNGTAVGTPSTTSFQDTSLQPNTTYTYYVLARDAAGNVSDPSDTASATTEPAPPGPTTITIVPTDDTYVRQDQPTSNFGSVTTIQVDGSPIKHILIKFTVTGVAGRPVTGAKLRLFAVDPSDVGGVFFRVTDVNGWTESTATWNTVIASESTSFGSLGSVVAGTSYEVSLPFVTADGTYAMRIDTPSSNGADYSSTEGANPPAVVITIGS
jgi:parallel beta-helix repeat protein